MRQHIAKFVHGGCSQTRTLCRPQNWQVRWRAGALGLVQNLVRARAYRAPPAGMFGWARRWWNILSAAIQQAVAGTALGFTLPAVSPTCAADAPPLERVLDCARADAGSRLPRRADGWVARRARTKTKCRRSNAGVMGCSSESRSIYA